ncbi:MAG: serine/threonine protein kinase [Clostridiales bacterium]|nr:serine/threonine protein kinase [Clostridiales bacterium]
MGEHGDDAAERRWAAAGDTTLFGKYQLCRVLGRGRSGTVYLAKHIGLEEYRAIKQVPKACKDYEQFRREALLLKTIRHPGIPVIYDLESDEEYGYIVEEFLEGDSLYALVSDMGHFSKAMTIRYGIQICHLVNILHSARPNPILYLDLQPRNLLVCHDTIKLVDFDHAMHLEEAEHLTRRYGTVGFAAPEQYTGDALNERTDIYAIGAVLYYMLTGNFPDRNPAYPPKQIDRKMVRVIRTCLAEKPERRYASAQELSEALEHLMRQEEGSRTGVFGEKQTSSLTIAVAGAAPGAGATHLAIGIAVYLRQCGYFTLYEEKNRSGAVRQCAQALGATMDSYGIYRIHGLPMLPDYGDAVRLEPLSYQAVVRDCGRYESEFLEQKADLLVLVCGSKPWEWETTRAVLSGLGAWPGLAVVYNHFCERRGEKLPAPHRGMSCFLMPYTPDPWKSGRQTQAVYKALLALAEAEPAKGILWRWIQKGNECLKNRRRRQDGAASEL